MMGCEVRKGGGSAGCLGLVLVLGRVVGCWVLGGGGDVEGKLSYLIYWRG